MNWYKPSEPARRRDLQASTIQDARKYQHAIRKGSHAPLHHSTQPDTVAQEVFHLNSPQHWVERGCKQQRHTLLELHRHCGVYLPDDNNFLQQSEWAFSAAKCKGNMLWIPHLKGTTASLHRAMWNCRLHRDTTHQKLLPQSQWVLSFLRKILPAMLFLSVFPYQPSCEL